MEFVLLALIAVCRFLERSTPRGEHEQKIKKSFYKYSWIGDEVQYVYTTKHFLTYFVLGYETGHQRHHALDGARGEFYRALWTVLTGKPIPVRRLLRKLQTHVSKINEDELISNRLALLEFFTSFSDDGKLKKPKNFFQKSHNHGKNFCGIDGWFCDTCRSYKCTEDDLCDGCHVMPCDCSCGIDDNCSCFQKNNFRVRVCHKRSKVSCGSDCSGPFWHSHCLSKHPVCGKVNGKISPKPYCECDHCDECCECHEECDDDWY